MSFEHKIFQRKPDSYFKSDDKLGEDPAFWNPFQIVAVLVLLGLLVLGEMAALVGLYVGGSPTLDALVWLGLVLGIVGVVLPLAGFQWRLLRVHLAHAKAFDNERNSQNDDHRRRVRSRGGIGLVLFFLFLFLALAVNILALLAQGLARLGA
jgi:hypothetical protein